MKKISRKSFLKLASVSVMSSITAGALAACNAASTASISTAAKYKPGTYTATAKGMGDITMTATFSETAITDIKLDLSNETDSIGQVAGEELVKQLLEAQNSTIDGVSGATITGDAVKQCMNDCMTQAMGGTTVALPETSAEQIASWRTAPEIIPDSEISKVYDVDVAIIGMGYAGLSCYRELAEQGKKVLVLEAMPRESWWTVGHDIGHINSEYLLSHGVPKVDVVEFVNNWMVQAHGKANTALVMKFAKNGGSTVDWWLDKINPDTLAKTRIQFWPDNEYTVHQLNNGMHYYTGTLEWWENYWENPTSGEKNNNTAGQLELKDLSWDNYNYVEENFSNNATALFGTRGVQLVMDGEKVTGVIAKDSDEKYLKINAKNGVVLAGGGFGGNKEMMEDLLPDISRLFTKEEDFFAPFGRDGSTIQMGVWAGGRLESDISTMNFDSMTVPDYLPGPLWVDENGQRFQNEAFAGPEINGFFMARAKRGKITSIYDSTYETLIGDHIAFLDASSRPFIQTFCQHEFFIHSQRAARIAADQFALGGLVRILGVVGAVFQAGCHRLALVFVQRDQPCCCHVCCLLCK